jgi:hypothetical protein
MAQVSWTAGGIWSNADIEAYSCHWCFSSIGGRDTYGRLLPYVSKIIIPRVEGLTFLLDGIDGLAGVHESVCITHRCAYAERKINRNSIPTFPHPMHGRPYSNLLQQMLALKKLLSLRNLLLHRPLSPLPKSLLTRKFFVCFEKIHVIQ